MFRRFSYIDDVILRNTSESNDFIFILTFHLQFIFLLYFFPTLFSYQLPAMILILIPIEPECFDFQGR